MANQTQEYNQIKQTLIKQGELCTHNPYDYMRFLWWVLITPHYLKIYLELWGVKKLHNLRCWLVSSLVWLPMFIISLAMGTGGLPHSPQAWLIEIYLGFAGIIVVFWVGSAVLGRIRNDEISNLVLWFVFVVVGLPTGLIAFGIASGIGFFVLSMTELDFTYIIQVGLIVGCVGGLITGFATGIAHEAVAGAVVGIVAMGVTVGIAFGIAGALSAALAFITTLLVSSYIADKVEKSLKEGYPSFVTHLTFIALIIFYFSFMFMAVITFLLIALGLTKL